MSVKFFFENYLDQDILANDTVSSEQASFPVENAYNMQRRSKVWRSAGYWKIESGKNTIKFKEDAATTLTATVAAAGYASTTSLCAAIKAALEAVGDSTYTVTQTATYKINIVSNGIGGDGIFQLLWTESGSADMAGILGFDTASDCTGALTYTSDVLKIHTSEWLLWDMGAASLPTDFLLIGPRNAPLRISPSATLKLQGNHTNNWTDPECDITLEYDDEIIAELSETGLHTEALRYWRLSIVDQNPLGFVEIGALFLGKSSAPTYGRAQFPFSGKFVDRSTSITSEGGQTFSDIKEKTEQFSLSWLNLSATDIEELKKNFEAVGTSSAFFIAFDTEKAFSSSVERQIKYVKFAEEPCYELICPGVFRMDMTLLEQL